MKERGEEREREGEEEKLPLLWTTEGGERNEGEWEGEVERKKE